MTRISCTPMLLLAVALLVDALIHHHAVLAAIDAALTTYWLRAVMSR